MIHIRKETMKIIRVNDICVHLYDPPTRRALFSGEETTRQACSQIYVCRERRLHNPYFRVSRSLLELIRVVRASLLQEDFCLKCRTNFN